MSSSLLSLPLSLYGKNKKFQKNKIIIIIIIKGSETHSSSLQQFNEDLFKAKLGGDKSSQQRTLEDQFKAKMNLHVMETHASQTFDEDMFKAKLAAKSSAQAMEDQFKAKMDLHVLESHQPVTGVG